MTVGVDGFVGERLVEAREASGIMSQSDLARLLDVSNQTISLYENNKSSPRPEMLSRLASLLKVKEWFFLMPVVHRETRPIFWRSRHVSVRDGRTVARRRYEWSKWLIDGYLKSFMDMPELTIPTRKDLGVPEDPRSLTDSQVDKVASIAREYWGLGLSPIDNLIALLENNGLMLTYTVLNSDKLDAFSNISEYDGSFHIRLSKDKGSATRSRFDAAHEVAHLLMHAHLPKSYFNTPTHTLVEHQANRFASAFLMPAESFKQEVWMTSIAAFKGMKPDWKVSVGAMIKRCDDLGLFGDDDAKVRRMWIKYKRDWQAIEEDDLEFEPTELMKRCVDALIDSKRKTKSQFLFEVPYLQNDVESLLNLPEGYLSETFGELTFFPTIKKSPSEGESLVAGQILSFPDRRKQ